jgi:hypothetical protein
MKKLFVVLPIVALIVACGSNKDPYEKRAVEERERQEAQVTRSIDQAPKWMTELPTSSSAVYANGTAVSSDFSMADNKAKMFAFGKICIAAGGKISQQSKIFMQDQGGSSAETSELAIKSMCPSVDVTGVEVKEIKRIAEGSRYRSYVLVALPTGDANALQTRKDRLTLQNRAAERSDRAFSEIDSADRRP